MRLPPAVRLISGPSTHNIIMRSRTPLQRVGQFPPPAARRGAAKARCASHEVVARRRKCDGSNEAESVQEPSGSRRALKLTGMAVVGAAGLRAFADAARKEIHPKSFDREAIESLARA